MTVLAHLSDLHLDGSATRASRASRVVPYLCGLPGAVDAVIITGDVTENGTAQDDSVSLLFHTYIAGTFTTHVRTILIR